VAPEEKKEQETPEEYAYYPGCSLHGTAHEYEESVQEVAGLLNIRLQEIEDWNCCGASSAHMTDHGLATELAARNVRIAEKTGISGTLILRWVNHVDLFRIKGVGEEYSDLLEEAGVDTVPELAQRNPENLYQKLVAVNQAKKLVRRLPTQAQVSDWIEQAKRLPRVVTY